MNALRSEDRLITRKRIWLLCRIAVPVLILAAVLATRNWGRLVSLVQQADYRLLAAAFVLYLTAVIIQGWRWGVLLNSDGGQWPYRRLLSVHFIAMFFDIFTPGKLGSDAYRLAAIRRPGRMHHMVMTLVAMRMQGLGASLLLASVTGSIILGKQYGTGPVAAIAIVLILALGVSAYGLHRLGTAGAKRLSAGHGIWASVGTHLQRAIDAFNAILVKARTLAVSGALVIVYLLVVISIFALVGRAFQMDLAYSSYLCVVPILLIAAVIPISIQGRGIVEVLAILLWQGQRATSEQIVLTCLAVYALGLTQALLGGGAWLILRNRNPLAGVGQAEVLP